MSKKNKKKKKVRGDWEATLKDGSTAIIRFMRQEPKEIEIITNMANVFFERMVEGEYDEEILELLEKQGVYGGGKGFKEELIKTGRSRVLVAEVNGKIVSFLEIGCSLLKKEIQMTLSKNY
jgi:hypothetical protein|tara:strand:- start:211 stop:573 length:363 start_codon:yes stop_codon:yes gene_type:complete